MSAKPTVYPRITGIRRTRVSDWMDLVENTVEAEPGDPGTTFHAIDVADYVSILAISTDGRIPIVRQFRPAVGRITTEFPGGLLESGETAAACAVRELAEEAGLVVDDPKELATFMPDSGRLSNRMRAFTARNATRLHGWTPEPGIEVDHVSRDELFDLVTRGEFDHGPHLAMLGVALVRKLV